MTGALEGATKMGPFSKGLTIFQQREGKRGEASVKGVEYLPCKQYKSEVLTPELLLWIPHAPAAPLGPVCKSQQPSKNVPVIKAK